MWNTCLRSIVVGLISGGLGTSIASTCGSKIGLKEGSLGVTTVGLAVG